MRTNWALYSLGEKIQIAKYLMLNESVLKVKK